MKPTTVNEQTPVPPPTYHREQARLGPALHIDALTLVTTLHLSGWSTMVRQVALTYTATLMVALAAQ
jgi:hypothetical protein